MDNNKELIMDDDALCDVYYNNVLWNALKAHIGHSVSIVYYGDAEDPADICLECNDCNEVILDAEIYTLCAREDI